MVASIRALSKYGVSDRSGNEFILTEFSDRERNCYLNRISRLYAGYWNVGRVATAVQEIKTGMPGYSFKTLYSKSRLEAKLADYFGISADEFERKTELELERGFIQNFRSLSHDEIERLVNFLEETGFFAVNHNNSERRTKRKEDYLNHICPIVRELADKTSIGKVLDVGTGDGTIFSSILDGLTERGQLVIPYSGDATDYCKPELREKIGYRHLDAVGLPFDDDFFDLTIECVMLHHLPSEEDYRKALAELTRVTKIKGHCLIIETVHSDRDRHYLNAILDIYLNSLTSIQEGKMEKDAIQVPINFLSEQDLEKEFDRLGLRVAKKTDMPKTENDPKRHKIYLLKKCQ